MQPALALIALDLKSFILVTPTHTPNGPLTGTIGANGLILCLLSFGILGNSCDGTLSFRCRFLCHQRNEPIL